MTKVQIFASPPEALKARLRSHIPVSLPLIRRLQFAGFPGGITEYAKILWVSRVALEDSKGDAGDEPFAAGYLDFSRGPETELWIYSSLEHCVRRNSYIDGTDRTGGKEEHGEEIACALALLREVKNQQDVYFAPGSVQAAERPYPTMLIGNMGENLRLRLTENVVFTHTGVYDKWVFDIDALPDAKLHEEGEKGWVWDKVREKDLPFMLSRTGILRTPRTMRLLPSTALYASDGTPIAWAFLGPDSSLSSLHCEEPYRGKGIAKVVAVKLLRDHLGDYGVEGSTMGWADVDPSNVQSQAVCRGLKAEVKWQISWSRLDLNLSFPD